MFKQKKEFLIKYSKILLFIYLSLLKNPALLILANKFEISGKNTIKEILHHINLISKVKFCRPMYYN